MALLHKDWLKAYLLFDLSVDIFILNLGYAVLHYLLELDLCLEFFKVLLLLVLFTLYLNLRQLD